MKRLLVFLLTIVLILSSSINISTSVLAASTGTIRINCDVIGAKISGDLNGVINNNGYASWGNMPYKTYSYQISAEGYETKSGSVTISSSTPDTAIINVQMNKNTGTIRINCDVIGAKISGDLNGVINNNGYASWGNMAYKTYSYQISAEGYETKSGSITLSSNTATINVQLVEINTPPTTLEEANISFIKLASDKNYIDDVVSIVAKIEGNNISDSDIDVIIIRADTDELIDIIRPITNGDYITAFWHTNNREEVEYDIHVIVYGESGKQIARDKISVVLMRPNSAKINVQSPNDSNIKKYEINSEILFEADIEGYGFDYTTFTVYNEDDTIKDSSEKLSGSNISYLWTTTGYEVGEYYLLIQTYDSNNAELDCKKIHIFLEEPNYADIIPDSENKKEYLVNDEVVYKARVEGSGYTYSRFIVRKKSNPDKVEYSIPQEIHIGEDLKFIWDTTGAEPGEYVVRIEVYRMGNEVLSEVEDTIILREQPSAKIVKLIPEDESIYTSNDSVTIEAEVEGTGYKYFRYIVNSENDEPVYDTEITSGEITPVQWNTAGYPAGVYRVFAIIYDANESGLDFSTTKIILTDSKKVIYGDLDGNGEVNAIDFANMRRIVLGMISTEASETLLKASDLNGDGGVNAIDLALLRQYVLGIIDEFPVEKSMSFLNGNNKIF